jgi:hypothetical protein
VRHNLHKICCSWDRHCSAHALQSTHDDEAVPYTDPRARLQLSKQVTKAKRWGGAYGSLTKPRPSEKEPIQTRPSTKVYLADQTFCHKKGSVRMAGNAGEERIV